MISIIIKIIIKLKLNKEIAVESKGILTSVSWLADARLVRLSWRLKVFTVLVRLPVDFTGRAILRFFGCYR